MVIGFLPFAGRPMPVGSAGQGAPLARALPAADLVAAVAAEMKAA
jgi:hypothetical protein